MGEMIEDRTGQRKVDWWGRYFRFKVPIPRVDSRGDYGGKCFLTTLARGIISRVTRDTF